MVSPSEYEDWEGTIEELADKATRVLKELGQAHISPPNVRVIRDYAQRGILSQAERRGKELYYNYQHLNELVAAKILINEGVPLAKIAEQFMRDRDIVIVTLGMHTSSLPRTNTARERWKSLEADTSSPMHAEPPKYALKASTALMQRSFEDTGQRAELKNTLQRLGADSESPQIEQTVQIKITDWCSLSLTKKYLMKLTQEKANDIGCAVATILSDPNTKRGVKK